MGVGGGVSQNRLEGVQRAGLANAGPIHLLLNRQAMSNQDKR